MNFLSDMNCGIVFLQDTHLIDSKLASFNSLWKGTAYHSCCTNNSRGTAILISNKLDHEILGEHSSTNGNYKLIECKIGTDSFLLGSIYGPNRDTPSFYAEISELLDRIDCNSYILGGDFNFVMDPQKDCYGYSTRSNICAQRKFSDVCTKHNLVDVWRFKNQNKQQFTWHTSDFSKGSRLDMFFVSEHLTNVCSELKIVPGYKTDHNIISMNFQVSISQRGSGLWKFNESLLNDDDYINKVHEVINKTVTEYALPVYNETFLQDVKNYHNIEFQVNVGLFYETLLMMIRGETVKYSKRKARELRRQESELTSKIANAYSVFSQTKSVDDASKVEALKDQLEEIRKPRIEGLIIRSRVRWREEGEKSSKYFLGLEKRNAIKKTPTVLTIGEQKIVKSPLILKAFTDDLTNKYKKTGAISQTCQNYIQDKINKKLSENECNELEQPISFEELTEALSKMKKGKSPGSNGFTAAFFKHFWNSLGPFLFRTFVYGKENGSTILSHREGIITLIPKAGKSPDDVKGWRPITLLNIDYKIISAAISARLQTVIGKLIDPCQTAYIKNRFIGENTRLVYDVINTLLNNDRSGVILSADFEAAFDALSWDFVSHTLQEYNFGPNFRHLISLLYLNTNTFSRIILNGYLGDKIRLNCGIRQGDPSSGYIFNLAVNLLANQIKQSRHLSGIQLNNNEIRISQYADDTLLFLRSSQCIKGALHELNTFSEASGLALNVRKTSYLRIGTANNDCGGVHGVKQVNSLKILGITFTNNNINITHNNFTPKLIQIEKEVSQWQRRHITPLGRIVVIKSLLLSKLVHIFTALPNPCSTDIKKLERLLFSFLWGSKRDPVKRNKACQRYENGGLQMVDIEAFVKSMKLTWLKRMLTSKAEWSHIAQKELPDIHSLVCYGSEKLQSINGNIANEFWKDVITAFIDFSKVFSPTYPEILSEVYLCIGISNRCHGVHFNSITR